MIQVIKSLLLFCGSVTDHLSGGTRDRVLVVLFIKDALYTQSKQNVNIMSCMEEEA